MPPDNILDGLLATFTAAVHGYYGPLLGYAAAILSGMAVLGLGIAWAKSDWTLSTVLYRTLWSVIEIGFVFAIMEHITDWGNAVIDTERFIGSAVSGIALTPSGLYSMGLDLITTIDRARGWGLWLISVATLSDLVWWGMCWAIQIIWLIAALVYTWTLIECLIIVFVGAPLILPWSATEYTAGIKYSWGGRLLHVGVKLATLFMMLAIVKSITLQWGTYISSLGFIFNLHFYYYLGMTLSQGLAMLVLIWWAPNAVASMIHVNGGASAGYNGGAEQFVSYGQQAAGVAITAASRPVGATASYVERRLLS